LRKWATAGLLLVGAPLACVLEPNPTFDGAETTAVGQGTTTSHASETSSAATSTGATTSVTTDTGSTTEPSPTTETSETGELPLGCGDGTIVPGERCHASLASVPLGDVPRQIAAGDLDGDGAPDIAVLGSASAMLVLWGEGDGSVEAPEIVALPIDDLDDLAIGDVDDDGDLDIVVASDSNSTLVTVLSEPGGLAEPIASTVIGQPRAIGLAQFDGAGAIDVLFVTSGSTARVARGQGDGTFVSDDTLDVALGSDNATRMITGDIDEDARIDAVILHPSVDGDNVSVVWGGAGGPGLGPKLRASGSLYDVALADLDVDGVPDIVIADRGNDRLSIVPLDGGETLVAVPDRPSALAAADFDNDGWIDLAIAQQTSSDNHLALRFGDGALAPIETLEYGAGNTPVAVAIADFNGDTVPDVAVASEQSEDLHIVASHP
jgi:hypothetical protein